ncbi:MAG: hypothetical protein FJ280_27720 [Planctomycetes bacterium]|nr:hypothetical protein [Planctomycetota bacterium]
MWSETQQTRIATERAVLREEMPQYEFYDPSGDTYVEGDVRTSDGAEFTLRCVLGRHFPDEMPRLYVASPHRLPKHDGYSVNGEGKSHQFHTLENGPNGEVQICHFKPDWWDSSKTLVAVLLKGLWWCEAYCAHLRTGNPISNYCQ